MGTNTDPYQPIEGRYRITRALLELCLETRHPVTITTKSDRVLRDLDLLAELAKRRLVAVRSRSPRSTRGFRACSSRARPAPAKRLAALGRLVEAGVPAHCSVAPVIPAITDEFIEAILARAGSARRAFGGLDPAAPAARGRAAVPRVARGPLPERGDKVMAIVRSIRGGRDNDPSFGSRMKPSGVWAELLRTGFGSRASVRASTIGGSSSTAANFVHPG
jgi:DNA repair photolyase